MEYPVICDNFFVTSIGSFPSKTKTENGTAGFCQEIIFKWVSLISKNNGYVEFAIIPRNLKKVENLLFSLPCLFQQQQKRVWLRKTRGKLFIFFCFLSPFLFHLFFFFSPFLSRLFCFIPFLFSFLFLTKRLSIRFQQQQIRMRLIETRCKLIIIRAICIPRDKLSVV